MVSGLGGLSAAGGEVVQEGDWPGLNKTALERAAYLGFAQFLHLCCGSVFWGPPVRRYRLALIAAEGQPEAKLGKLIWLLEWPGVRLLGLTFAFTGNF